MALPRPLCAGLLSLVALTGCSGLMPRLQDAALSAAKDPWTWAPLAGAGVIALSDSDERISDWASEETPVYGSNADALEASSDFRQAANTGGWLALAAARPRGEGYWLKEKGVDAAAGYAGIKSARTVTGYLKGATDRERPNGDPTRDSFPSAHATEAFAAASLARYYADGLPLSDPFRAGVKWSAAGLAAATAWARVEGGVHYPTDVLVGAAIANFSTRFFLHLSEPRDGTRWQVRPMSDGESLVIGFEKRF